MAIDAHKPLSAQQASVQAQDTARLLLLSQLLQASLEPEGVIQRFFDHVGLWLKLDGLSYRLPQQTQSTQLGERGRHSCDYRLNSAQQELGQYIFSRNHRFSESERAALEHWLSFLPIPLSNAIEHSKALQMTRTDSLTGLGNRAAMDAALKREVELIRRHKSPFSLLVVDVDRFKTVNDRYGHTEGDRVLQTVAQQIQSLCRESDLIFRYGGEEFVILLNKTDWHGAHVIAERIRRGVESRVLAQANADKCQSITVSVGISSWDEQIESGMALFDQADHALFRAKSRGRNRVIAHATDPHEDKEHRAAHPPEPVKTSQPGV